MVVAAETMTRLMALEPRVKQTAILFGNGAGACLETSGDGLAAIREVRIASDATFSEALRMDFGFPLQTVEPSSCTRFGKLERAVAELLGAHSLQVDQVGLFLFHQANLRLLERLMRELRIEASQCFMNVEKYGNTSSASWLIAASEARASGLMRPGTKIVIAAFGAGLSWGAALLEAT